MIDDIKVVYHYCSTETFLKILSSYSIFLTHCRMLNDGKEDRIFMNSISDELIEKLYTGESVDIIKKLKVMYQSKVDFPYVACFSKEEDSLEQWTRYGDDGKGVAIGFDLTKIPFLGVDYRAHGQNPKLTIDEVFYSEDNYEFINNIVKAVIRISKKNVNLEEAINQAECFMENISIFGKSPYFKGENEVRMVYHPCYRKMLQNLNKEHFDDDDEFQLDFLSTSTKIKSYFKYKLPKDSISSVMLGPKNQIEYKQLTLLLSKYAPRVRVEDGIKSSKITYIDT